MRILFVTSAWPLGRSYGGQMRALNTANALSRLGTVSIQVVGYDAADEVSRRCTEAAYEVHTPIVPQVTPNRGIAAKMRWAFSRKIMNVHGCTASEAERGRIRELAHGHDL